MKRKEILWQLETHSGNEWRNIWSVFKKLSLTDEQIKEIEEQIFRWLDADRAYREEKRKWWIIWEIF